MKSLQRVRLALGCVVFVTSCREIDEFQVEYPVSLEVLTQKLENRANPEEIEDPFGGPYPTARPLLGLMFEEAGINMENTEIYFDPGHNILFVKGDAEVHRQIEQLLSEP